MPEHKALRKTFAQWVQDEVSEEAPRLYRGESGGDTHSRNYIRPFTALQVAKLEAALRQVHSKLFSYNGAVSAPVSPG